MCACFDKPTLSHNAEEMFSKKGLLQQSSWVFKHGKGQPAMSF